MEEATLLRCPSPSVFILDDDLLAKISLHLKPRKRVSFYDDDNLVHIREIPPRGDSPSSDELEECDSDTLADDLQQVSLSSFVGSYDLGKSIGRRVDVVSQITGISPTFAKPSKPNYYRSYGTSRSYVTSRTVIKANPSPTKTRRTRKSQKDDNKQSNNHLKKSSSQTTLKQRESLSKTKKQTTAKERAPSASKSRIKSPNPDTSGSRPSTPKNTSRIDPREHKSSVPSTAAFQETTNSLISELPWLTLPRIHHSPYSYRRVATPPLPGKGVPSPVPTNFTLQREGSQTSISSLDFKTLSPRTDSRNGRIVRDSGTPRSSHRMYAWQVANGMTSATPIMTPCISQMWDVSRSPVDSIQPS